MKKLLFLCSLSITSQLALAQDWLQTNNGATRSLKDILNFQEEIKAKNQSLNKKEEDEEEDKEFIAEGKNYHYDRWKWYWEQHTDTNGNLVGPAAKQSAWNSMQAQKAKRNQLSKTTSGFDNWSFQGPNNSAANGKGIGRINTIAFHPTEVNTFWIGSAGGGPWKTTDGGLSWAPVYSNIATLGVSDIEFNPLNPSSIFICTGDRDAGDNYSIGVIKSTNGGVIWDTTGFKYNASQLKLTNDLAINYLDTNKKLKSGYHYWVNVKIGDCESRIYYNGPYAKKRVRQYTQVSDSLFAFSYPNPAKDNVDLTVSGNVYGTISIQLYNAIGAVVYETITYKSDGVQKYTMNLEQLSKGIYYVIVSGSYNERISTKIQKY